MKRERGGFQLPAIGLAFGVIVCALAFFSQRPPSPPLPLIVSLTTDSGPPVKAIFDGLPPARRSRGWSAMRQPARCGDSDAEKKGWLAWIADLAKPAAVHAASSTCIETFAQATILNWWMRGAAAEPVLELGTILALDRGSTTGMDGNNTRANTAVAQLVRVIKVGAIAGSRGFRVTYRVNQLRK